MSAADINLAQDLHQVAKVYGVDPDLVLRRRFRRLHYFNLFYKHARLVALDQSVANYESLKQTISTNGPQPAGTVEETPKIAQLLKDIEEALKDFDTASLIYQRSISAPEIPPYLLEQIKRVTSEKSISYSDHYNIGSGWDECAFHTATEKSLLHRTVDRFSCLQSIFVKKKQVEDEEKDEKEDEEHDIEKDGEKPKKEDPIVLSYSEDRVRRVVDILINLSFCMVVLIPTIALSYMKSQTHKMIVLAVSVLLAAVVSSFLASTMQKPSLGVIAAYTAILVVFLSNNPGT